MTNRSVFYLMSNEAYMPYLVTSLYTLRKHWGGRVVVYAWPECIKDVQSVAQDVRLEITVQETEPEHRSKNAQFLNKIQVARNHQVHTLRDVTVYLDADTLIAGSLEPLFEMAIESRFIATQFNAWLTSGQIIKNRIQRLRAFPGIDQHAVETLLRDAYPSVNGGIFAFRLDGQVLDKWREWTKVASDWPELRRNVSIFIADEAVLHLMQIVYDSDEFTIAKDGVFNMSTHPKYQPKHIKDSDVAVWHGHGNSFARPDKGRGRGAIMWKNVYEECCRLNIGGIADWPSADCGNGHLKELFSSQPIN